MKATYDIAGITFRAIWLTMQTMTASQSPSEFTAFITTLTHQGNIAKRLIMKLNQKPVCDETNEFVSFLSLCDAQWEQVIDIHVVHLSSISVNPADTAGVHSARLGQLLTQWYSSSDRMSLIRCERCWLLRKKKVNWM